MPAAAPPIPVIESIADLAAQSDAWLLDVWGVLHNGVTPFATAVVACERFRASGGIVVLLSNSPRPCDRVAQQLDGIGVGRSAYDGIVSSGDATRVLVERSPGAAVFHLGPARDRPIFDTLDVRLTDAAGAALIVCTGLFDDEHETPDDYRDLLDGLAARRVPMICANPDLKVDRGGRIIWCAGGIAAAYEQAGGAVVYAGKPYPHVYEMASAMIAGLRGHPVATERLLAIGDGVGTDILGACRAGIAAVYIASGIHVADGETLDSALLDKLFVLPEARPVAAMSGLRW